jgi:hypothetical protein
VLALHCDMIENPILIDASFPGDPKRRGFFACIGFECLAIFDIHGRRSISSLAGELIYSGKPASRSAAPRVSASAGAQFTLENWWL